MKNVTIRVPELGYAGQEAYRSLRTNLQFCGEDKRVIAVTSCTPGEGKSSVTLQLAVALTDAGKKVLVIDGDLRRSGMTKKVQLTEKVKGLSHFLSGQSELSGVICATDVKLLHMIFAGPVPPNPAELLENDHFSQMLATVGKVYDYVLIDTPPLGSVIDSAVIAEQCDGAILILESGAIKYRFAQDVKKQLERSRCPVLGAVLTKVKLADRKYRKYSRYDYRDLYEQ